MDTSKAIKEFLEFEPKELTDATNCLVEAIKLAIEIQTKVECEIAVIEAQNLIND